jgi:hypothetical protein
LLVLNEINDSAKRQDPRFCIFDTDKYEPKTVRDDFCYAMKFTVAVVNAHSLLFDMPQVAKNILPDKTFINTVYNTRNYMCHNPIYKIESQYSKKWFTTNFGNKSFCDISDDRWKIHFEKFINDSHQYMVALLSHIESTTLNAEYIRNSIVHRKNIENLFFDLLFEYYKLRNHMSTRLFSKQYIERMVLSGSNNNISIKEIIDDVEKEIQNRWCTNSEFKLDSAVRDILTEKGLI